ncbi:MAG TPA: cytochrome b N-terminal domain-containing protein [bacterium]
MSEDKEKNINADYRVIARDNPSDRRTWISRPENPLDLFDFRIFAELKRAGLPAALSSIDLIGKAMLVCLIAAMVTGVALLAGYSPTFDNSFNSIREIQHGMWAGWLFRGVHKYSTDLFVILAIMRLARICYRRSYKGTGMATWAAGILFLVLIIFTGQIGYILAMIPAVNEPVGFTQVYLTRIYATHIMLGLIVGLIIFFTVFQAHRKSPKRFDFNPNIPAALMWGTIIVLSVLALIIPPRFAGDFDTITDYSAWFIWKYTGSGYYILNDIWMGIFLTGFFLALLMPMLDRSKEKGPRPDVTALLTASLITGFLLLSGGMVGFGYKWVLLLVIAVIWVIFLGIGFTGEMNRKRNGEVPNPVSDE